MPYLGEIAALTTAFCWAISVVYFRRLGGVFSPLSLNLWKGLISIAGLLLIVFISPRPAPEHQEILWLMLSGVIGIGIGDTAFFAALNRMGERSTLLLAETLAPVFTAILAMLWISEWLSVFQWLAIGVILLGVDLVLRSKKDSDEKPTFSGLSFAALAALCQAVGAVIGRDVLISTDIDVISASLLRLLGGLIFIVPMLLFSRQRWLPTRAVGGQTWKLMFLATFIGTFIAMVLQTFSFAHAPAAIVQSLFASSIIFSLVIAKVQGVALARQAILGSSIATLGVALIFLS